MPVRVSFDVGSHDRVVGCVPNRVTYCFETHGRVKRPCAVYDSVTARVLGRVPLIEPLNANLPNRTYLDHKQLIYQQLNLLKTHLNEPKTC